MADTREIDELSEILADHVDLTAAEIERRAAEFEIQPPHDAVKNRTSSPDRSHD